MNTVIVNPYKEVQGLNLVTPAPASAWIVLDEISYRAGPEFDLVIPKLALRAGAKTAIVGGNGSGKTTLLKLLLADLQPDAGVITLQGEAAGLFGLAGRQNLGVQLQETGFNPVYRVRDIFAVNAAARPFVDPEILDLMGIPEIAKRRFGDLSSGQKQRVQLALALAHKPQFAIFDEPTSNLDPVYEEAFVDLLNRLSRGNLDFTAIYISHTAKLVESCDQILILAHGRIETYASLDEVVTRFYGEKAALFEGAPDTLSAIAAALPKSATHKTAKGRLRAFGDTLLTQSALTLAQNHTLERFSTWNTCAADILEDLKND